MKIPTTLIISLLVGVLGLYLFFYFMENRMIFYPVKYPHGFWNIEQNGLPLQDCYFKTEDGVQLHGWFLPSKSAQRTVLWLHGNAGNISHRLENIQLFQRFNFQLFIFDYRGYGRSDGSPTEKGLYRDAQAAFDFLVTEKNISPDNIVIFGRSLGGGVATELALQRPCAGLILESGFISIAKMARQIIPILPTTKLLRNHFDSQKKLAKIQMPVLVIHGERDELIPFHHGKTLFQSARPPKYFYPVPTAGHNDLYQRGGPAYFQRLKQFTETLQ